MFTSPLGMQMAAWHKNTHPPIEPGEQDKSRCSFSLSSPPLLHWSIPRVTVLFCLESIRLATVPCRTYYERVEIGRPTDRHHPLLLVVRTGWRRWWRGGAQIWYSAPAYEIGPGRPLCSAYYIPSVVFDIGGGSFIWFCLFWNGCLIR